MSTLRRQPFSLRTRTRGLCDAARAGLVQWNNATNRVGGAMLRTKARTAGQIEQQAYAKGKSLVRGMEVGPNKLAPTTPETRVLRFDEFGKRVQETNARLSSAQRHNTRP